MDIIPTSLFLPLQSGTRLGPYEVTAQIGVGGMGEVYQARDTRLKRDVALKVLPDTFAQDADRLARFQREAECLAALNHPHIAGIYGLEEANGVRALVLELVEGPTLADRIAMGPMPLDESLLIARQIADALDAAHERGIVHRDLKPANIKVMPGGVVKVLDFGLAKASGPAEAGPHTDERGIRLQTDLTHSPTMMIGGTRDGMLLGTAPYMSPEQARGKPVDKRTDVWAFGCVLFEMLTGHGAFAGETVSDTISQILQREPAWDTLPDATPPLIRRVLHRCLEKDLKRRVRDIADVRLDIEDALAVPVERKSEARRATRTLKAAVAVAALVVTATAVGAIVWNVRPAAPSAVPQSPVTRFVIKPPEPLSVLTEGEGLVAISLDGRRVAYVASATGRQQLYVRETNEFESRPIPGTEGGSSPVFSPDGQSLAFVAGRKLKRVPLNGGAPQTLVEYMGGFGLSWAANDTILYSPGSPTGIWQVSANGGTPIVVTTVGKELQHLFPEMLPNGNAVLFDATLTPSSDPQVFVQVLDSGERRSLFQGTGPHYLPTGHLVYVQAGKLMAVAFDLAGLKVTGTPVVMLDGIRQSGITPQISFSGAGSMVYVPAVATSGESTLVFVDRTGVERPTSVSGRPFILPRLAPDGQRVAAAVSGSPADVWEYDLARETSSRMTDDGNSSSPLWAPDGHRLTFSSGKGASDLYWKPIDGNAPAELLLQSDRASVPASWSPDGRVLAFVSVNPRTANDIWLLNLDETGDRRARPFLQTQFREGAPVFSPDGKWLAYVSDESGRPEVYARPVTGPGEKWTISAGGGTEPVWPRGAGVGQLFYRIGDAMMVADVKTTPTFVAGKPRRLFEKAYEHGRSFLANYDVSSDGKSLLMIKGAGQEPLASQLNVVLNWLEELKQRVPTTH